MSLLESLTHLFNQSFKKAFPECTITAVLTVATQEHFGHYQCNSAFAAAKLLKQSPHSIAQQLIDHLEDPQHLCAQLSIAGGGFINIVLHPQTLSNLIEQKKMFPTVIAQREKIIVEYSSTNIAKQMHVGHLRSTIIGDSIARLFTFLGYEVLKLNHVGDWGTSLGMLLAFIDTTHQDLSLADLDQLMQWYVAAKEKFDRDAAFKTLCRHTVVLLQQGDPKLRAMWEKLCALSRQGLEEIYRLLDIQLQERGESFYQPLLSTIVKDLEEKGLVTISDGAKCVFHEGFEIPLMIQKSDGGFNYATTDIAALWHRIYQEKADRIIVVVDAGQKLHFDLIQATAKAAGYLTDATSFEHVTFGVVLNEEGKKFRTRDGDVEKLIDLLQKAIEQANHTLLQHGSWSEGEELDQAAILLGVGAVKYADLSCNREHDYVFSYERMLRFEGNTICFILYAYVRIVALQRKCGVTQGNIDVQHPAEISLAVQLLRFPETLMAFKQDLKPHYLTDYLYLLAQKFHLFFRDCRVEGAPQQASRLALCQATKEVLQAALHILGIQTLDKM